MDRIKAGLIGCGNISGIYAKNCTERFNNIELIACADLVRDKAEKLAHEYNIPVVCTVDELLDMPEIDLVLNLTVPSAHFEISYRALESGKHVYSEKPLAINRKDGLKLLNLATKKGLYLGCAPDTFMGGALQTARKLLDDGWIGRPVGATAFMMGVGPETWHPSPDFFYKTGGGPLFDMGPYYLNALINLSGPVKRISGTAKISFPYRVITTGQRCGEKIECEVPTHVSSVLDFKSDVVVTMIMTFDTCGSTLPHIEIYGQEGTLSLPDPNYFGGRIQIKRKGMDEWEELPLLFGFTDNSRGIGIADMANSIKTGSKNRANGEMAFHVLDIMQGIYDASEKNSYYIPISSCVRPEPLSKDFEKSVCKC